MIQRTLKIYLQKIMWQELQTCLGKFKKRFK
uniref:Uncharacterized protein n=1 Tax=Lepeophtheirus salmonis TaxID=72036 RepID=A0A0K2UL72_LEPSM